jgi:hypothetical protein
VLDKNHTKRFEWHNRPEGENFSSNGAKPFRMEIYQKRPINCRITILCFTASSTARTSRA